jgi:hypothetical protein
MGSTRNTATFGSLRAASSAGMSLQGITSKPGV